jgi:26S proteasome regulatory subunit N5
LVEAVENLLVLEKQTRQAEDHISTGKLAVCIVTLCYEAGDWKQLNHYLQVLAKRRGQLKPVRQLLFFFFSTFLNKFQLITPPFFLFPPSSLCC